MIAGLAGGDWVRPAARPLEGTVFWGEIVISAVLFIGGIAVTIGSGWISGVVLTMSALGAMGLAHGTWRGFNSKFAVKSDGFSLWVRSDAGSVRQLTPGDVGGVARRYIHHRDRAGDVFHSYLIVHGPGGRCLFKLHEERWKHGDLEELCRVVGHPKAWPGETRSLTKSQLQREFPGVLTLSERHPIGVLVGYGALALAVVALILALAPS